MYLYMHIYTYLNIYMYIYINDIDVSIPCINAYTCSDMTLDVAKT